MDATIHIAIIEDEPLVMESLKGLFATQEETIVCAASANVEALLEMEEVIAPHIILLDINLRGGMSGVQGIPLLKKKFPEAEIIMLTTFEDGDSIFRALCAGATAYLTKRASFDNILEAIHTVHQGGSYMSPTIARKVVEHFAPKKNAEEILSPRQQQIVDGIVEGLSYKMIAAKLMVSTETVKDHIKNIYRKLQINSKGELIRMKLNGEIH